MVRLVISQNERILLHLSELDRYRDEPDVPMGASQEGIAQRMDTQVFNASRALSSLESDGLVFDRLAHVRGAPKRRRAYFLTEKGKATARAIRTDIGKRVIVIEHAGKTQELTVDDAVRRLGTLLGRSVTLTEVVEKAREFDMVISSSLAGTPEEVPQAQKECVLRSHGRPKVDAFFGRDPELKALMEMIRGKDEYAVLIWGMPGIGKSTLASRLFDDLIGKRSLFWYSFREWDTEESFLNVFTEFLLSGGRTSVSNSLKRGRNPSDLFIPIMNDLSGCETVLFLDDVQKPAGDISSVLSVIIESVKSSGTSKVILISRSVPSFFSKTEQGHLSLELSGIDRESAWKFGQSLKAKDLAKLVDESHGHPLLLNLMARGGVWAAKGDVIAFIEREVQSSLSTKEKEALELLSVYRHPIPVDALGDIGYKTISDLRKRALVVEQEDGIWTHDLLRDFFWSHIGASDKVALHRRAAAYCERREGVEWRLEALYHAVEGMDWTTAAKVATEHARELGTEFPRETLAQLSRVDPQALSSATRAEFFFVRGQLNENIGGQEAALADFEQSLALLGSEVDSAKRALVLETIAKLKSQLQKWAESVSIHEKALRLYEKAGDKDGQAREWMNMGGAMRSKGDARRAREAYGKALSLASMEENRASQAACLNNLGLLDWDEGKLRDAETHIMESVKLAHTIKDFDGEGRGLENLGSLRRAEGRLGPASSIFIEASDAFIRAGENVDAKRLRAMSAEVLGAQGRFKEGIDLCEKSLAMSELRPRRGLFQRSSRYDSGDLQLSSTLVDLLSSSGDYKKAMDELSRFIIMGESIPDKVSTASGKLMASVIQEDIGSLDSALRYIEEAYEILRSIGDDRGLIAVHMRRGVILEKKGDFAGASRDYAEAARHAELVEDKAALALAKENLRSAEKDASKP